MDNIRELARLLQMMERDSNRFKGLKKSIHCGPPLTVSQLSASEEKNGVTLPKSYRAYLKHCSNGSFGPDLVGVLPLQRWGAGLETVPATAEVLQLPCLLREELPQQQWDWLEVVGPTGWEEQLEAEVWSPYQGCITVTDRGCAGYTVVPVNGIYKDRVWLVDHDFNPPVLTPFPSFVSWLLEWANAQLELFPVRST